MIQFFYNSNIKMEMIMTIIGFITTIMGLIAAVVGIPAAFIQIHDYLEKRRGAKLITLKIPPVNKILPLDNTVYDIFISHRSRNKNWVETLARNLKNTGYSVTFNPRTLNALQNCHKAILVATPEAIESGWVREEYDLMLKRQQNDPDFTFIPIVFNEVLPDFPFLSDIEVVNFSTEQYHEAFHRLISHLGEKSFNKDALELPPQSVVTAGVSSSSINQFIETLFDQFKQNCPPPLMVLAQMDRSQSYMIEALQTKAQTRYSAERCLHITPPYSTETDTQGYFSVLARQCELNDVKNGTDFEQALQKRLLNKDNPLFLLVSRFEHGPQLGQQQLAGILRSLNENYANQLYIIICGGEKLADLKYRQGNLSLLNIALDNHWPELNREDVYVMRDNCCKNLVLNDKTVKKLLELSGGHPTLLQKCLRLYEKGPTQKWRNYLASLSEYPLVWQLFTPFTQSLSEAKQVCEWLTQKEVAPVSVLYYYGHKHNALLRRLYWKNVLVEKYLKKRHKLLWWRTTDRKYLCWRCEALRLAGKKVLGESNK